MIDPIPPVPSSPETEPAAGPQGEARATVVLRPPATGGMAAQARHDAELLALWLHGRGPHTGRAYAADARAFLAHVGQPLREITVGCLQGYSDSLAGLTPASRARKLAAVKSLLSFAHRLGYTTFDVGRPVRLPAVRNRLAERILPESDMHRLIALEPSPRNRTLLRLMYGAGLRISEACGLRWRDLQARDDAGQVSGTRQGRQDACDSAAGGLVARVDGAARRGRPG